MEAQLINYVRLSKVPVGYLINFRNAKVEWRRFICTGGGSPLFWSQFFLLFLLNELFDLPIG